MDLRKEVREANIRHSEELCKVSFFDKPTLNILDRKRVRKRFKEISKSGGYLLDLGCAHGEFSSIGKRYFAKVFFVDISYSVLLLHPNHNLRVQGDVEHIPFRKESFDAVVTSRTLHHLVDCRYIFKEIYRVLKKDGVYYLEGEPNRYILKGLPILVKGIGHFLKKRPFYQWRYHDKADYSKNDIDPGNVVELLKEAGFKKIDLGFHWTECGEHILARVTNFLASRFSKRFGYRIYAFARK